MSIKINFILNKLKEGKKDYFDEFYNLTKAAVFYTVKKYLKVDYAAEDIMQETYISFLENLRGVKGDPVPYLITIAKNKSLDYLKKESKIDRTDDIGDLSLSVEDTKKSEFVLLDLCRRKLNDEDFKILELSVVYGYKRVEVAKMLDKPVSTVNRRYNDILKKLKTFYKEAYL